ncbi:hypothetical protein QQ045_019533 [Rhodiola kirilowii]
MEGNNGRRIRREQPEINDLPDGVLDNIVSRLSIQDAVRAALVAKPWRHCWKLTRELGFDCNFYNEFIRVTNYRLDAVVKSVLSRHIGPIRKFNLYIPPHIPANDASFDVSEEMSILSEKKVEHLSIYVCNQTHLVVPASIYNFSYLEHLELQRCRLSDDSTSFNGFPKLESIKLSNVIVLDNILRSMLSLSPQMAQIDMECFNDGNPVELHQAAVENLEAIFYHCMARVVRPLRLTRLPSMKCASFETQLQLPGCPSRTSSLEYFSSLLPRVEDLYLDAAAILSLYDEEEYVPRTLVTTLGCLKTLAFEYIDIGSYPMLSIAFCLMRSAPNLESMEINIEPDQRLAVHAAARNFLNEQLKLLLPPLMTLHTLFFKNLLNTGIEMKLIQTLIKLSPRLKAVLFRSSTDIARDTERKMHRKLRRIRLPEGARFNFEWAWQELR